MTDSSPKRDIGWLMLIAGVPLAIVLATLFMSSSDTRESLRQRIDKLRDEAKSRKLSRTVFRGPTTPGNAWDEYMVAIRDAEGWKEDPYGASLARFAAGNETTAERAIAVQMIRDHSGVLGYLRRGVQKENGQIPIWDRPETPPLLGGRKLSSLAGSQARALSESGRSVDAVELALDMTVFARDVAGNGNLLSDLVGGNFYSEAADAIRTAMLSGKLTARDFEALAANLEKVEQDFPAQSTAFRNETMANSADVFQWTEEMSSRQWLKSMVEGGWRYGLSSRELADDYVQHSLNIMERTGKLEEMDYAAAMKEAGAVDALAAASKNPLIRDAFFIVTPAHRGVSKMMMFHREVLAKLRLLRAAAVWAATGSVPKIADPLGADLRWTEEDGKLRLWSVGGDGKDDEGQGEWYPNRPNPKNDIVLELPESAVAKSLPQLKR
jgi:hypothetical protein